MDPRQSLTRYANWFRDEVAPFWAQRAWDETGGGFYEALDFSGAPAPGDRRVRVQARQIYTFAELARRGWLAEGEGLARRGFEYFLAYCCPGEGARGCVHRQDGSGAVIDDRRDLYDQAFLLLACATMIRAFDEPRAHELAARTAAFLDGELASPNGGFLEDDRGSRPRRQNPHMHLLEAFMALHTATGEAAWLARADAMHALFDTSFFDREAGVLREFFTDALAPDPARGDKIEPGHMAEWVWLLEGYAEKTGADVAGDQRMLLKNAVALGAEPGTGFLVDATAIGAAPARGARRLWGQTEYLKALLVFARRGGANAAAEAGALTDRLFETYFNEPVEGLWCDRFGPAGERLAKDVPASILYHLFESVVEVERYLEGADR